MNLNLPELTEEVRRLAVETGRFIRGERNGFSRGSVEKKHAHDYVSYVDRESERRIVARLRELLPEAGFIAEEGSAGFGGEPYCWVVDPLDGTTNFIHDNAPYCVSIALRSREEILLGVVYEICRDECFWTYKGAPSYLNGKEIHVSQVDNLDDAFIALGFPYDAETYKPTARRLVEKCYGNVTGLRLLGAAAAELCYVAAGRFEARIEALIGPWDIAAGTLIFYSKQSLRPSGAGGFFASGHRKIPSLRLCRKEGTDSYEKGIIPCCGCTRRWPWRRACRRPWPGLR